MPHTQLPDFDDLPYIPGTQDHCAWGIWDKDGKKDVFGTLNLLSPDVVKEAYSELKDGISVSLNWPIGALKCMGDFRKGLTHKVIDFRDKPDGPHAYDDEVEFNTQCSSQWDSLCHFHHQPTATAYNGVKTSKEELSQEDLDWDKDQNVPTLNHWHRRGGVVARGVLIDFLTYAQETGRDMTAENAKLITTDEIEAIAKRQGVSFKTGDVIIVRTGYTETMENLDKDEQMAKLMTMDAFGVRGDVDTAKWFWNNHFAAVAGDSMAFENVPPLEGGMNNLVLHQYFLTGFGMPIGELWDLKELSRTCKRLGRYSFLLTSVPLNVPGLVGSPPNALALF